MKYKEKYKCGLRCTRFNKAPYLCPPLPNTLEAGGLFQFVYLEFTIKAAIASIWFPLPGKKK